MKRRIAALLLLITCCLNYTPAQEKPNLFSRIKSVFEEKEPAWKFEDVIFSDSSGPIHQSIKLNDGENQAVVAVWDWKEEKVAHDAFAADSLSLDNGMGKRMTKSSVPKLGDENHIWTHQDTTAWPMLKFRKGSINVTVYSPSVEISKRFAQYILEQIAAG
jgi:hypothetical protein